jgi:hypothetical protein
MKARGAWRPGWLRVALGLWVVLGLAAGVRTLVSPERHSVFPVFAGSAQHWWADRCLYHRYLPLDMFRYPPAFAVTITPFAFLGLRAGGMLWIASSLAVLLAGLWCFARDVAPGRWTRPCLAAFLILAAVGAARGLWNAQSNALAVGLVLLAASAVARALATAAGEEARQRRRWWRAAVLLAVAVCLKLTPLAPALLLCALWPRRLGWRFALATVAGFLIPFLTKPVPVVLQHYEDWLVHLLSSGCERWQGFRDSWTVWVALRYVADGLPGRMDVCHPIDATGYRALQLLAALGALAWCLWQGRRAAGAGLSAPWPVHAAVCVGMAWLMLFGPAVEHATYVFLAAPLAWAVVQRHEWPAGRGLIVAAAVLILGLGWGALARAAGDPWPGGDLLVAALPVGTALFTLWLVGYGATCGRVAFEPPAMPAGEVRPAEWDAPREAVGGQALTAPVRAMSVGRSREPSRTYPSGDGASFAA